jgi:CxxC-x17-CxxC domain-containing protein
MTSQGVDFQDRVLKCIDCGTDFVFSAGEQLFYHEKEFRNEPKRCRNCKAKRQSAGAQDRGGDRGDSGDRRNSPPGRVETSAVCSQCGRETTVPFRPTQGRPVFCRQCFQGRKATGAAAG